MKVLIQKLKKQDGFTLVELMVVVAIIGLLSAVAVPNFKKYQSKAKMTEAKLQLSALYTAESAFFSDYNMYASCLAYMGFDPGPEINNRYYLIGFSGNNAVNATAHGAAVNSGLNATDCPAAGTSTSGATTATNSVISATWFPAGKGVGASIATVIGFIPTTATVGAQSDSATMVYAGGAGGVISPDFIASNNASQMVINQQKVLSVTRNGF